MKLYFYIKSQNSLTQKDIYVFGGNRHHSMLEITKYLPLEFLINKIRPPMQFFEDIFGILKSGKGGNSNRLYPEFITKILLKFVKLNNVSTSLEIKGKNYLWTVVKFV